MIKPHYYIFCYTLKFGMAYKPMDDIVANIRPTAEIIERIKPVYNFKAAD